jgi:hypothetical protein
VGNESASTCLRSNCSFELLPNGTASFPSGPGAAAQPAHDNVNATTIDQHNSRRVPANPLRVVSACMEINHYNSGRLFSDIHCGTVSCPFGFSDWSQEGSHDFEPFFCD